MYILSVDILAVETQQGHSVVYHNFGRGYSEQYYVSDGELTTRRVHSEYRY